MCIGMMRCTSSRSAFRRAVQDVPPTAAHGWVRDWAWGFCSWGIPVSALTKHHTAIVPRSERFSHDDACRVCRDALKKDPDHATVVIDLRHAREVTTAAFARLVLLRRRLRADGRDLRLTNLHERAASLYEVNRLASVLPRG